MESRLYDAVKTKSSVAVIQQLLNDPTIDINWANPTENGNTALILAADNGHTKVAQLLVQLYAVR